MHGRGFDDVEMSPMYAKVVLLLPSACLPRHRSARLLLTWSIERPGWSFVGYGFVDDSVSQEAAMIAAVSRKVQETAVAKWTTLRSLWARGAEQMRWAPG